MSTEKLALMALTIRMRGSTICSQRRSLMSRSSRMMRAILRRVGLRGRPFAARSNSQMIQMNRSKMFHGQAPASTKKRLRSAQILTNTSRPKMVPKNHSKTSNVRAAFTQVSSTGRASLYPRRYAVCSPSYCRCTAITIVFAMMRMPKRISNLELRTKSSAWPRKPSLRSKYWFPSPVLARGLDGSRPAPFPGCWAVGSASTATERTPPSPARKGRPEEPSLDPSGTGGGFLRLTMWGLMRDSNLSMRALWRPSTREFIATRSESSSC
mmetsp:Transcript_15364/g.40790  ORF Transcript_15364/g.40790 Transcript_15364/m.40790 type:complete len:268 (+) Transcript_15364:196-999(+)